MPALDRIADEATLDELFELSNREPVVIFKHSSMCPISSHAFREIEDLDYPVRMVVVQNSRPLSEEISSRTSVRHETPQVILLRNGIAVWTSSHWNIERSAIETAIEANK